MNETIEDAGCQWSCARMTGTAHRDNGTPCQDALGIERVGDAEGRDWIIAAIADGAGSSEYAGEASALAVKTFMTCLKESLSRVGVSDLGRHLTAAATAVHFHLQLVAEAYDVPANDLLTTLIGVVSDGRRSAVFQIGDGCVVSGPPWRLATRPQHGQYINETVFVTEPGAVADAGHALIEGADTIVLASDGLEGLVLAGPDARPHAPFFDHVAGLIRRKGVGLDTDGNAQLAAFVESDLITSRTDDDISLIVLHLGGRGHD